MKPVEIQSRSNPKLKALKKLHGAGFNSEHILVEGSKLLEEALKAGWKPLQLWSDGTDTPAVLECPHFRLSPQLYRQVSPTKSGHSPLAVFAVPQLPHIGAQQLEKGRYLLLDRIQEPGNAGALVRAAAAFDLAGVLWLRPCVFPFHHACIRASAGAVFHLPSYRITFEEQLFRELRLIGAEARGQCRLEDFRWPENFILALGNEGHGLSLDIKSRMDTSLRIPMSERVESLNVAGAAHILMQHCYRQTVSAPNQP